MTASLFFDALRARFRFHLSPFIDSLFFLILLTLSLATYERNLVWKNDVSLWEDVVRRTPGSARGHYNLGNTHRNLGELDKAIREYQIALELVPNLVEAHNNLGMVYYNQGRLEDAIKSYRTALQLNPKYLTTSRLIFNLALAYADQGRLEEAIREFQAVLRLEPNHVKAHYNLGRTYVKAGRLEEAKKHYEQALQIKPDFVAARQALDSLEPPIQSPQSSSAP
jgi:tetratricopeptide (TPR) repeat protein